MKPFDGQKEKKLKRERKRKEEKLLKKLSKFQTLQIVNILVIEYFHILSKTFSTLKNIRKPCPAQGDLESDLELESF